MAELTGVSRDTLRQMDARFRTPSEPYAELVKDGRRRVYETDSGLSPNITRALDKLARVFAAEKV
jgi:hypothetical protein